MAKDKAHAKLSASGSDIWLHCAGSVALSEKAPPKTENQYMREGTKAHGLLEEWLLWILRTTMRFVIPKGFKPEMADAVRVAVREVEKRWRRGDGGILLPERRVHLTNVGPDMFGTADITIVEHYGRLTVLDYKHGSGHPVDVVDPNDGEPNSQLVYYALAVLEEFGWDFQSVEIGILQPRAIHHAGPTRTKTLTLATMRKQEEKFKKAVDLVNKHNAPLVAGSWCLFCQAKTICKEFKKTSKSNAAMAFAGIGET